MPPFTFTAGIFQAFRTTRALVLRSEPCLHVPDETLVRFDGTLVRFEGTEVCMPQFRVVLEKGWAVPAQGDAMDDDLEDCWAVVRGRTVARPTLTEVRIGSQTHAVQQAIPRPQVTQRSQTRQMSPNEWLFHAGDSEDGPYVVFTPVAYWTVQGAQWDQEVEATLRPFLPSYLHGAEIMEATFELPENVPIHTVTQDLLNNGFRQTRDFSAFMDSMGGAT